MRAFAGLCLGACTYVAAEWLGCRQTVLRGGLLTLVEIGCLGFIAVTMYSVVDMNLAIFLLILFALLVTLSFSGVTYIHRIFSRIDIKYVEQFAVALYLTHGRIPGFIARIYGPHASYEEMIFPYILVCIITALADVLIVNWVMKRYRRRKKHAKA